MMSFGVISMALIAKILYFITVHFNVYVGRAFYYLLALWLQRRGYLASPKVTGRRIVVKYQLAVFMWR